MKFVKRIAGILSLAFTSAVVPAQIEQSDNSHDMDNEAVGLTQSVLGGHDYGEGAYGYSEIGFTDTKNGTAFTRGSILGFQYQKPLESQDNASLRFESGLLPQNGPDGSSFSLGNTSFGLSSVNGNRHASATAFYAPFVNPHFKDRGTLQHYVLSKATELPDMAGLAVSLADINDDRILRGAFGLGTGAGISGSDDNYLYDYRNPTGYGDANIHGAAFGSFEAEFLPDEDNQWRRTFGVNAHAVNWDTLSRSRNVQVGVDQIQVGVDQSVGFDPVTGEPIAVETPIYENVPRYEQVTRNFHDVTEYGVTVHADLMRELENGTYFGGTAAAGRVWNRLGFDEADENVGLVRPYIGRNGENVSAEFGYAVTNEGHGPDLRIILDKSARTQIEAFGTYDVKTDRKMAGLQLNHKF